MAKIILRVIPTAKTMAQALKGVKTEGSRILAGRALAQASDISKGIGDMLVGEFNKTVVARALRGHGAEDLPAHLGLDDSTANALVDGMAGIIRTSVRILSRSGKGSVSLRIQAVEDNWNEYLTLPGARYVSYPSKITIPVVKWLLVDPSIDIGAAAYQIVFSGESEQFNTRIQKISRSGRAIMVSLKSLGGGGSPYVLPAIVSGGMGENFIELTLGQKDVAMKAAMVLMKKIR